MKKIYIYLLFILSNLTSYAQVNYDTGLIQATLKNRAIATIRNQETVIDMRAPDNVIHTVNKAVTVYGKNGDENAELTIFYNENATIKSIKGEIYNQLGKLIGKFSQNDFRDESAIQDFSLFEDSRVKHYSPIINDYPYTIVYNYEIRYKQNLIIPEWIPQQSIDISVEKSSYTFISKPNDELRIRVKNFTGIKEEFKNEKQQVLSWKVENLTASKPEPYSPFKETYLTNIKIAPKNFSYYNYKGSYTNWNELGKWTYDKLLQGRSELPPATIATIKELVKNETSDRDKAKKIYEYLQNKTRYISIQVGIGGFQPYSALEVDRLGYGDCKGLVNYMQSLLATVNIESLYCVVEAGSSKINMDKDFASMDQGNHIILCMPLNGDTTWLECTNQKIPFGFLGDFTDDRLVLACTSTGGKLLKTPKLSTQNNLQIRNAIFNIDVNGDVDGKIKTIFSGAQYQNHEYIIGKSESEQDKMLKENYDVDNIKFTNASYHRDKSNDPKIIEDLSIYIKKYGTINNDIIYFLPNTFNIQNTITEIKKRTLPIYINRGFTDIDSITYNLADKILPVLSTKEKVIKNEFGSYYMSCKLDGNKLIYYRKFVLNEGTFPAENYTTFSNFINEVNTSDLAKIALNLKR